VKGNYKGDMEKLKIACNTTIDNLDDALQQVSQGTEQVASASQQISAGSQSLAQGANQQASSLEEISAVLMDGINDKTECRNCGKRRYKLASEANLMLLWVKRAMDFDMSESINKIKETWIIQLSLSKLL
jgi:methyl-accepting chemotaxis protein